MFTYTIIHNTDGYYYKICGPGKFRVQYGPFIGPESTKESAKILIEVLQEYIQW
jgi:hypothetical protein